MNLEQAKELQFSLRAEKDALPAAFYASDKGNTTKDESDELTETKMAYTSAISFLARFRSGIFTFEEMCIQLEQCASGTHPLIPKTGQAVYQRVLDLVKAWQKTP